MPTTPTGNFALTLRNLETLIVNSSTFRTMVAQATADAARDRVYWLDDAPASGVTAFAWIKLKDGWAGEAKGPGAFWNTMPLQVMFQRPDTASDSAKERQLKFWNTIGAVIAEMQALAQTGTYLHVERFQLTDHVLSDPKDRGGVFQQCLFDVQVFG